MNEKKKSSKSSQLSEITVEQPSQAAIKRNSAPRSPPSSGKAIYNPAHVGEGNASKIWELLRQNPTFQRYAEYLLDPSKITGLGLGGLMSQASENEEKKERDQIIRLFPYLNDEAVSEIIWRDWDDFFKEVPFYALRRYEIFAVENLQNVFGPAFKRGPIFDKHEEVKYTGPLKTETGDFTFDTPWCDTPELFRKHFAWLWCHFVSPPRARSPVTASICQSRRPPVGWLIKLLNNREIRISLIWHAVTNRLLRHQLRNFCFFEVALRRSRRGAGIESIGETDSIGNILSRPHC